MCTLCITCLTSYTLPLVSVVLKFGTVICHLSLHPSTFLEKVSLCAFLVAYNCTLEEDMTRGRWTSSPLVHRSIPLPLLTKLYSKTLWLIAALSASMLHVMYMLACCALLVASCTVTRHILEGIVQCEQSGFAMTTK